MIEHQNDKVIEYVILKHIGTIFESEEENTINRKEINIISYDKQKPVFDIRAWNITTGDKTTRKRGEGITLTTDELKSIYHQLRERFAQGERLTGGIKVKGMILTADETINMYEILVKEVFKQ